MEEWTDQRVRKHTRTDRRRPITYERSKNGRNHFVSTFSPYDQREPAGDGSLD